MYCKHCGLQIGNDSFFCTRCGTAVAGNAARPATFPAPPPMPASATGGKFLVRTQILGTEAQAKAGSALGRAVVGDAIAGPTGAIVGGMTGKNAHFTNFNLLFNDGTSEVKRVQNGSYEYNYFAAYLNGIPKNVHKVEKKKFRMDVLGAVVGIVLGLALAIFVLYTMLN